jgi:membrane protein DedA with SNARE-associated domain
MPTIDQAFAWLLALPPVALYGAAFGLAFIENLFPPAPSDVLIGFCVFIAAAGGGASLPVAFASVLVGSVAGAAVTYAFGRRYGAGAVHARVEARGQERREERLERMYMRYGLIALFIARLLPGVRFLVPMVAGAFRVNAASALGLIAAASGLWYGALTWLAFRVGDHWEAYAGDLAALGKWGTIIGLVLAAIGITVGVMFMRRRRRI